MATPLPPGASSPPKSVLPPNPGSPLDNRGPALHAFIISVMVISMVFVAMRFWSRSIGNADSRHLPRFWWDDWIALSAVPFLFAAGILMLDVIKLGFGKHTWYLKPANVVPILSRLFAVYYLYNTGLTLAKMSCLLFYTRIFSSAHVFKWFSKAIWVAHTLNLGVYIGNILTITFNLSPRAQLGGTFREDTARIWLGNAIPGAIVDLLLLLLPMPMIWKLRVDRGRKLAIACIFVCGYSVIVVSLGRVIAIALNGHIANDLSYDGVTAMYWQAAEIPMTLICICLPSMMNLWRQTVHFSIKYLTTIEPQDSCRSSLRATTGIVNRQADEADDNFKHGNERNGSLIYDDHSIHDNDTLLLKPITMVNCHTATVSVPEKATVRADEEVISAIRVQRDIYVTTGN